MAGGGVNGGSGAGYSHGGGVKMESDGFKGEFNFRRASKPHSTPATLNWLEENYEFAEGVCIPRSTLYFHYLDFCEKSDCQPVNAASFGKVSRGLRAGNMERIRINTSDNLNRTCIEVSRRAV